MYLALIFLIFVAIVAAAIIGRVVKSVISLVRNGSNKENPEKKTEDTKKTEDPKQEKKLDEAKAEELSQSEAGPALSEEQTNRYALAKRVGITEDFWKEPTEMKIDGKDFADRCVESSGLTYLEVNNRVMAGEEFNGFNILIEENQKMTLTYQGQAIATLTRSEKKVTKTVDGKEVSETHILYRTNTFPPKLSPGMVPDDLEKMFAARDEIRMCEGDPQRVASHMRSIFSDSDNVDKLKQNIDPKIQAKESKSSRESQIQSTKEKNGMDSHHKKMM